MEEGTKRRLVSRGLLAPDNWLKTCVDNFRSSNQYAPGQDKLQQHVFEQWLEVDLCELRVSSFPPNLKDQLKVTLNGIYTCQMVSIIDSGHSAYSQYQKIRKEDTGNLAIDEEKDKFQKKHEPKSSRTLSLYLTDGTQEFRALEVQRISSLSINLFPGCKVMIKGPVICRRGIVMLEKESQIQILGGKVDAYLIPNAYENILALSLGLETLNENARIATGVADDRCVFGQQENATRNDQAAPRRQPPPRAPVPINRPAGPPPRAPQTWTSGNEDIPDFEDDFADDDFLMSVDLDNVIASQEALQEPRSAPPVGRTQHQPVQQSTTGRTQPVQQSSTSRTQPVQQSSTGRIQPVQQSSTGRTQPVQQSSTGRTQPVQQSSTGRTQPVQQSSTSRTQPVQQSSTGRTQPVQQSAAKQATTIDKWFKPNSSMDSKNLVETRKSAMPVVTEITLDSPPRIVSSAISTNSSRPVQRIAAPAAKSSQWLDDDEDIIFLDDDDFDSLPGKTGNEPHPLPVKQEKLENVPRKLADVCEAISKGQFRQAEKVEVKVKIYKVVKTLKLEHDEWVLEVIISQGSALLEVSVSSQAVTKIFGMSPAEGKIRRKEAATNLAVREEMKQAFRRLENTLKTLDCIFEILIKPDDKPTVVNIQV